MTDREKLVALFEEWGVLFNNYPMPHGEMSMIVDAKICEKAKGYKGFYTEFSFDAEGKFKDMGVWE